MFFLHSYSRLQESGFYYLKARYYDPEICRFINADGLASTGQGFLGTNMFAYCLNNPVNGLDPNGAKRWYIDGNGNPQEDNPIMYSVPCLDQGRTNLCWAYSILMRKCYETGSTLSEEEYGDTIKSLGIVYGLFWECNIGLPFFLQGEKANVDSIEDLYQILDDNGPVYAAYKIPWTQKGHIVLVTGVDIMNNYVYTNNPWGEQGCQSYSDFISEFYSVKYQKDANYQLYSIYIPSF